MNAALSEQMLARFLRDRLALKRAARRLIAQADRKLDEIVAADDAAERARLREEFRQLQALVQMRLVLDGFQLVARAERDAGIEGAKHARDAKYSEQDRKKAVSAISQLRKANPRMSMNSAAKRVKVTTGIPVRTLSRWAAGR